LQGADDPIVIILLKEIDQYKRMLPYLKSCMRGAGWEDSHWLQMFTLIGLKTNGPNAVSKETVTLTHFLNVADAVVANADAIRALDAQAQGESTMRKALAELKLWGLQREFELSSDKDGAAASGKARKTPLIKEWRNVMSEVGDHQSMVASLKQSSYLHLFKDEVNNWEGKFGFLQEGLQLLNQIQRKWVYLEPIFARGALPAQQVCHASI
jgi:dynein heavy chain 2